MELVAYIPKELPIKWDFGIRDVYHQELVESPDSKPMPMVRGQRGGGLCVQSANQRPGISIAPAMTRSARISLLRHD
jgi:hypothetical protein